jgi:hypothetical protein
MTHLEDRLYLTLASLSFSSRGSYTPDGRQYAQVEVSELDRTDWLILPDEIDRLEAWGWIELLPPGSDEPPDHAKMQVTDRGDYWLKKWLKKKCKRGDAELRRLLKQHWLGDSSGPIIELQPVPEIAS